MVHVACSFLCWYMYFIIITVFYICICCFCCFCVIQCNQLSRCECRLNDVFRGKEDRIEKAKSAFDQMNVDEDSLQFITLDDLIKAQLPIAIARQLHFAISALH